MTDLLQVSEQVLLTAQVALPVMGEIVLSPEAAYWSVPRMFLNLPSRQR